MPGGTVADDVARKVAPKNHRLALRTGQSLYVRDPPGSARCVSESSAPPAGNGRGRAALCRAGAHGARNGDPIPGPVAIQPYQTMGLLTTAEAAEIARLTGVEAVARELWDWTVDASTVRKVHKDHGDDAAEAMQGQTGVKAADYALLPKIVAEADRIEYGGISDVGRPVVRIIKRVGDLEYWAVFEVRAKRRMLALQSMWIRGRPPALRP